MPSERMPSEWRCSRYVHVIQSSSVCPPALTSSCDRCPCKIIRPIQRAGNRCFALASGYPLDLVLQKKSWRQGTQIDQRLMLLRLLTVHLVWYVRDWQVGTGVSPWQFRSSDIGGFGSGRLPTTIVLCSLCQWKEDKSPFNVLCNIILICLPLAVGSRWNMCSGSTPEKYANRFIQHSKCETT